MTTGEQPIWQSLSKLQNAFKSKPIKKIISTNQIEYDWACSNDPNNFLTVSTDKDGAILSINGHTSTADGEATFASDLMPATNKKIVDKSAETTPASTTASTPTPVGDSTLSDERKAEQAAIKQSQKQAAQMFNEWFNVHLENETQLENFGEEKTISYFDKLRTCTPGIYNYPLFDVFGASAIDIANPPQLFHLATATISGYKNGLCAVSTSVPLKDRISETQCNYSQNTLNSYTNDFAKLFFYEADIAYDQSPNFKKQVRQECKKIPSKQDIADQDFLRSYIGKFKSCTPGTYTIPRPPGSVTTIISGYKDNKCVLQGTVHIGNDNTIIKCAYSQESLDLFVKIKLDTLNGNAEKLTPEAAAAIQAAITKSFSECNDTWMPL